jgi:Ca2+-binding EF-hand superfamily protein
MDNRGRANDFVPLVNTRFLQSDADDNGYLNEQEYTGLQLPVPFALLDTNGDGMLMRDELQSYTKNLARLAQATVVLTVSDDAASLFQLIDEGEVLKNRLTSRELMTISTRLPRHDQNKDGVFDRGDFVSEYKLSFGYKVPDGFASQITATPGNATMPGRRPAPTRSGPLWFQRMDRNRDKDISWREFLGPRSTFDRLDTNRDGLIDKDEAEAAEPAVTSQADATSGS